MGPYMPIGSAYLYGPTWAAPVGSVKCTICPAFISLLVIFHLELSPDELIVLYEAMNDLGMEYALNGKSSGVGIGVVPWHKVDNWRNEKTG
jgi:hypothetical protein